MYSPPMQSPGVFSGGYGAFLNAQQQQVQQQMQAVNAANSALMHQQQYNNHMQAQHAAAAAAAAVTATSNLKSPALHGPLSPLPSGRVLGIGSTGVSMTLGNMGMASPAANMPGQHTAQHVLQMQHQQQQLQQHHPMDLSSSNGPPATRPALQQLAPSSHTSNNTSDSHTSATNASSSSSSGHTSSASHANMSDSAAATAASPPAGEASAHGTSAAQASSSSAPLLPPALSSSSSLLSKRAPFKAALSLEIPTKPNVAGGVDITNAPPQTTAAAEPASAPQNSTHQQQQKNEPNQTQSAKPTTTSQQQQQQQPPPEHEVLKLESNSAMSTGALSSSQSQSGLTSPRPLPLLPVAAVLSTSDSAPSSTNMSVGGGLQQSMAPSYPPAAYPPLGLNHMGYSPLTSPSAFMSTDAHQQAHMMFSHHQHNNSGSGSGLVNLNASNAPGSSSSSVSQSLTGPMLMPPHGQPPIPLSPYGQGGQWNGGLPSPTILSPTALRFSGFANQFR